MILYYWLKVWVARTDHYSSGYGVPLEPECDERTRDENYAGNEDRRKVERAISREYKIHF